ncbi:MAG: DUF2808 domain-containing protein [Synechococcus sp.]
MFSGDRIAFSQYPLLTNTSQASVGMKERYTFDITLPENADEALRTVTFKPVAGSSGMDFNTESAIATVQGETVSISATTVERDGVGLIEVTFDEAITAGNSVTITLEGSGNHVGPGTIGVLASAEGPNPLPYFLGCLPTVAELVD